MFRLPPNIRLPGFRVGLPDDPSDQNSETVPGLAVPALGYDPDGNALQTAQATGSAGFDPRGLVPVNCTSDGSTNCTTPGGQSFTEPRPQGFPARIAPDDPNYHYYHLQSEPLAIPAEKLLQAIIANPTPNFFYGRPATANGTPNEATPDLLYGQAFNSQFLGIPGLVPSVPTAVTPLNPVTSYVTKDKDGNPMVVNMTERGHGLSPGYVAIYVTSSDGVSTIHVEGEGLSPWQASNRPEQQRKLLNDDTWRDYFQKIGWRAK